MAVIGDGKLGLLIAQVLVQQSGTACTISTAVQAQPTAYTAQA